MSAALASGVPAVATARRRGWVAGVALAIGLAAGLVCLLGGFGYRWQWWSLGTGFAVVRWAAYVAVFAAALGLFALLMPPWRRGLVCRLIALGAVFVGVAVAGVPFVAQRLGDSAPRINEVSTDTDDPPAFVALLPLRAGAANPAEHGGAEAARLQREGFPDIVPMRLSMPPADAFARVELIADAMGWQVVASVPDQGRLEAVAETPWFGLRDDVVVRVSADGAGSRVDIRSKSRIGRADRGMNGRRVREFLQRLSE